MSISWSWYVIALVALNILGCVWLLWWTARRRPGDPAPEETSHVWDGDLTEYNKPLPRWWINLFYLTIVFGVGYLFWYGGLGGFSGYGKWSSASEHAAKKAVEDRKLEETFRPYDNQPIDALAGDPKALALGRSIFNNTCATCHGSSAQGATGYPNLTDQIWHWGGSPEKILETVLDGRQGIMPEWGTVLTGMGGANAVDYTIAYMRTLGNPEALRNDFLAAQGKKLYEGVCVACHGIDGKGNQDLGAPDLTDGYWLYGSSKESLQQTITAGRQGTMPAHRDTLGETRSRLVAAYVWSLSNAPLESAGSGP
ncbi:cytochrome-c oxidase, cbb3-type subunit III [Pseudoxanthomonas wuyuanensis]|uniref:Cbb3-type cytochrome c oxidase subunit n=1 Tax=Pseudoxanthomonas wuyuanensis TaxID=1073196 RepID=A0A286DH74_9GAMM|nr:cytochrome-c oxidase, cbb3-type subunit III [Pseudoxanthomonas wuyuanensis]KAF1717209.1 cytochrome-c oxidase, cbb3-type subunit III [Pseudoxanthomonas wuyuanensis]SOD57883.1 cytochrome c oxidase cbb3-type subunit 3 [Pseudoxanthomonas wuyuanensis]